METMAHIDIRKLYELINKGVSGDDLVKARNSLIDLERYLLNLEIENTALKNELSLVTENGYLYK